MQPDKQLHRYLDCDRAVTCNPAQGCDGAVRHLDSDPVGGAAAVAGDSTRGRCRVRWAGISKGLALPVLGPLQGRVEAVVAWTGPWAGRGVAKEGQQAHTLFSICWCNLA